MVTLINLSPALLSVILNVRQHITLGKKTIIHQVTTILVTSKNVLFPGHNHLQTAGADDMTL